MVDTKDAEEFKKVDSRTASRLYSKDQRTIRRWCEQGNLLSRLDPGGNWEIFIPLKEYKDRNKQSV